MKKRESKTKAIILPKTTLTKSKGLQGALFSSKKVTLTPASVCAQKAWGGLVKPLKKELRKNLPDNDKDGVPNGFDCKPKNKRRQESFLPQDAEYLNKHSDVKLGKLIGYGCCGDVHDVVGNKRLVAKIPQYFVDNTTHRQGCNMTDKDEHLDWKRENVQEEIDFYNDLDLNNAPLFIPTKVVTKVHPTDKLDYPVMVRPRVAPLRSTDRYGQAVINPAVARKFTDKVLEEVRRKLINLSQRGISLDDGLQIGIDPAGRPLIYDAGRLHKYTPGHEYAYDINNDAWLDLLIDLDKYDTKYGTVNKDENY